MTRYSQRSADGYASCASLGVFPRKRLGSGVGSIGTTLVRSSERSATLRSSTSLESLSP